jgi:hypothetical protein
MPKQDSDPESARFEVLVRPSRTAPLGCASIVSFGGALFAGFVSIMIGIDEPGDAKSPLLIALVLVALGFVLAAAALVDLVNRLRAKGAAKGDD